MKRHFYSVGMMLLLGGIPTGTTLAATSLNTDGTVSAQQNETCGGIVKDASGQPVIGASVMVKGTQNGNVTDVDGRFSLRGG